MQKKKIVMYVYGDITTDARVQRAATALADQYDLLLISNNCGKKIPDTKYRNILVGNSSFNIQNYFTTIYETYKIVKKEKPDLFYGHDYYSSTIVKMLIGRKYCKKIVYDAHELYIPQEGYPLSVRSRFFYTIEKSIVNKVDLLICASPERAKIMQKHYKLKELPTSIRNISQLTINSDPDTEKIILSLKDFFSKPGKTLVYAGTVMASRRIDEITRIVCQHSADFKLLVVGRGDALEKIKQIAAGTPTLVFAYTGAIPYKSLGAVLSRCDIGYVYNPNDILNNIYCAPNKVYEYTSVSLPILSNENPTVKKELEQNHIGIATDKLEEGLLNLSKELETYKEKCKQFSLNNPWSSEAELLKHIIDHVIN